MTLILLCCALLQGFSAFLVYLLSHRVAPRIDLVLISHPDLKHLGALPYAFAHLV